MAEAPAADVVDRFWKEWHRIVAEKDVAALADVLAEDVAMGAPPYWEALRGRDLVQHLLGLILHTIEEFTYHREWCQGGEFALEFKGSVGGRSLQGIDLISLDEAGRVRKLEVLIRPLNTLEELRDVIAPQMQSYLQRVAAEGAASG